MKIMRIQRTSDPWTEEVKIVVFRKALGGYQNLAVLWKMLSGWKSLFTFEIQKQCWWFDTVHVVWLVLAERMSKIVQLRNGGHLDVYHW